MIQLWTLVEKEILKSPNLSHLRQRKTQTVHKQKVDFTKILSQFKTTIAIKQEFYLGIIFSFLNFVVEGPFQCKLVFH